MRSVHVSADVVTVDTAIGACSSGQQWQCTFQLLEEVRSVNAPMVVVAYNGAICTCERGRQW